MFRELLTVGMRPEELQFIELGESLLKRSDYYRDWADEYESKIPKIEHFKPDSQEHIKKVDHKLSRPPWSVDAKTIRDEISQDLFVKSEYEDAWNTYENTKRFNFSSFLKDVLPYVDSDCIQRLKHGKHFRGVVDGIMEDYDSYFLEIAGGRGGNSAVVNPNKTRELFTEPIVEDLSKKYDRAELVDLTKDEELVNEVVGEPEKDELKEKERRVAEKDVPYMSFRPSEHRHSFQDFQL